MRSSPAQPDVRGFTPTDALLALMALIWGVNVIVIKAVLDVIPPLGFNALRFPLASVVLLIATWWLGHRLPARRYWWPLTAYGFLGNTLYQLGFIVGLGLTRAGNAALLMAANPVLTAVISHWRGHERVGARGWLGLTLSAAGVTLVVVGSEAEVGFGATATGDLLILGATVCWALYAVGSTSLVRELGSTVMTAWTTALGAVPIALMGLPSLVHLRWRAVTPGAWGAVLYASLGAIVTGYLLWARGIKHLGSTRVAQYSNATPVFTFLAAWPLLGETPTVWQVVGGSAIVSGMYLTRS